MRLLAQNSYKVRDSRGLRGRRTCAPASSENAQHVLLLWRTLSLDLVKALVPADTALPLTLKFSLPVTKNLWVINLSTHVVALSECFKIVIR